MGSLYRAGSIGAREARVASFDVGLVTLARLIDAPMCATCALRPLLAEHLNFMHQVQRGSRRVTLRSIDRQTNAELQRELIDAYGGLERYLADAGAKIVHEDETGRLVRREAGDEPIIAVQVVCPTTVRQYVLRVPPKTKTAREGVAWTFGLPSFNQPTIQS